LSSQTAELSRRTIGRLGGLSTAAKHDPRVYAAKAQARARDRFLDEVDPDHTLPGAERQRRAVAARKLWFAKLAMKSARVRAANRKNTPADAEHIQEVP
jgi:hypothetical protein